MSGAVLRHVPLGRIVLQVVRPADAGWFTLLKGDQQRLLKDSTHTRRAGGFVYGLHLLRHPLGLSVARAQRLGVAARDVRGP